MVYAQNRSVFKSKQEEYFYNIEIFYIDVYGG